MYSLIELAECRCQDFLAEAARERLASQVVATRPPTPQASAIVSSAAHTVIAAARGALDGLASHTLKWSGAKSEQPSLVRAQ